MSWHKIRLVLRREYLHNFRRPSFLLTAFGIPLLSIAAMFIVIQFAIDQESDLDNFATFGYIDRAGVITGPSEFERFVPVSSPELTVPSDDASPAEWDTYYAQLADAATQQLLDGTLDAYLVIAPEYIFTGQIDVYAQNSVPAALNSEIENMLRNQIAAEIPPSLGVSPARLSNPTVSTLRDIDSEDEVTEAQIFGRLMLPFIFVFIYFMASNTTSQFLMSGVVEEKENRLMEILATSIRPLDLLWGKLLGLGALSLTQIGLWSIGGLVIVAINDDAQAAVSGLSFRTTDIVLLVIMFITNFMLFAAVMLGIGASTTAESESRQVASIFTLINVLPMALLVTFITNPNGPLPMFFTFFPLTSAVGVMLRIGLTNVPTWQIVVALVLQFVLMVAVMWLAAKVFRLGMLMYGKALTPRTLWRALRAGRTTLTTAPVLENAAAAPAAQKRSLFRR